MQDKSACNEDVEYYICSRLVYGPRYERKSAMKQLHKTLASKLGAFEVAILIAVLRLRDNAYGAEIHRHLSVEEDRRIAIAQVFNTLDRLREKELLACEAVSPPSGRRGPHRNVYRLTKNGEAALSKAATYGTRAGTLIGNLVGIPA
jgi:PadR family transcriptional regulator, regulatory protein PadR